MNKTPEQTARDSIDAMLERSGWVVVDKAAINWSLGPGLAVREYQTDVGPADQVNPLSLIEQLIYLMFIKRLKELLSLNGRQASQIE